ncbi:hypothetical protein BN1723_001880 [Verticillium longisporum]|uniref:DNA 3'-5' helicase n=1 Tax=Verticillium longisporum TaxID=100787 RepID=A0A0G4KSJ3_VERLO|nr:hypothetical protein BN1723_001880 [Verticillium longisporum]
MYKNVSGVTPSAAESLLASLNKAQCRAVTSSAPTVAILAGPGSGKTHTLTSRVVWLLENAGYHPADIVVATFTVKSAREMKERIGRALGDGREKKIVLGTFHSIARRYLAAYGQRIGLSQKFGIADDGDSRAVIQRICKRLGLAVDPHAVRSWISKKKAKGSEQHTAQRPNAKKPRENPEFEICFREYQDHLERSNLLDYDDLLTRCVELLRKHPSCVSNVQAVLIDEYQDTNGIQYELMRLFAQARDRITIVGDPDQSIYGWRSAEIKNLYRLLKDFPRTDEISLEENYRSSQAILDVSLKVIQQDKKRYQKLLLPVHNKGTRPVLRRLKTAANEAEWLVSEIRRAILMSGKMMNEDDVAILLRSAALSRHIESALGKSGIPYRMVGGKKFYERIEVKILIDYLRVIHQPENNDSLARIINVPRRGIGDVTIKSLVEEAETAKMDSLLASLNKAQCRAVTSSAPTVAILAGPGSGKTHTLTSRVVWLLENAGYHPADIVVATFTVKSAREMKERIGRALGDGREKKIVLGTFHSIARRYLATYGQRIGLSQKFGIADDGDSRAVIQRICKRLGLVVDPHAVRSWISKKKAKGSEQHIAQRPNAKKPRENPEFETCFREYQDHLERSNLLDYDDLLTKCVELLRKHPSCVSNVQAVLIDEYQDTNGIQYELMRLFAQARDRITIVGDPDQSIYGWRSAEIKNLIIGLHKPSWTCR